MNLLDEEVFAVLLAIVVVASAISIAMILRPSASEPFPAIGLLNENCKIGDYPSEVLNGFNATFCLFVYNNMGQAMLFEVRYKLADNSTLPTNSTWSPSPVIEKWDVLLENQGNATFLVSVPVAVPMDNATKKVALVFELWMLDPKNKTWIYTGNWVDLFITVRQPLLGG